MSTLYRKNSTSCNIISSSNSLQHPVYLFSCSCLLGVGAGKSPTNSTHEALLVRMHIILPYEMDLLFICFVFSSVCVCTLPSKFQFPSTPPGILARVFLFSFIPFSSYLAFPTCGFHFPEFQCSAPLWKAFYFPFPDHLCKSLKLEG